MVYFKLGGVCHVTEVLFFFFDATEESHRMVCCINSGVSCDCSDLIRCDFGVLICTMNLFPYLFCLVLAG